MEGAYTTDLNVIGALLYHQEQDVSKDDALPEKGKIVADTRADIADVYPQGKSHLLAWVQ